MVLGIGKSTVTKLIGGKQPVDAAMAVVLEEVFGTPAEQFYQAPTRL